MAVTVGILFVNLYDIFSNFFASNASIHCLFFNISMRVGFGHSKRIDKRPFSTVDKFDQHLDSTYIASNVYRQPAGVGTIGNLLTKFEEENGFKHVTCHGLRRKYCSLLLTQNVP